MVKKLNIFICILIMSVTLAACSNKQPENNISVNNKEVENRISVIVSFNPLKEFAEVIGGEKVSVKVIVPEGTEPHDFEPKPRDMESINNAKIFVYNGLGMESWVDKTLSSINNKNLVSVDASKSTDVIKNSNQADPHIWLSLKEAKIEANNIKEALIKVDPANKDYYEKNYDNFSGKLDNLYNEYKVKFDSISDKNFVTGHDAFAYLCRDFGLDENSVEDVFAEGEPTPKRMKDLVDYCIANNIKVVFMEELASPKVSETLAKEVGAHTEKIYTIESREDNKDYLESMKYNLEKIYTSLK